MIIQEISSNTVRSYNEIINYFETVGYEFDQKFVGIPDYDANGVGCRNFWRLYKKQAKNQEAQNRWNDLFSSGSVWKHPITGEWRFYFNFIDSEEAEKIKQENEAEKLREKLEDLENMKADDSVNQIDAVRISSPGFTDYVPKVNEEQTLTEELEKKELDQREGFSFTEEQLNIIRNL